MLGALCFVETKSSPSLSDREAPFPALFGLIRSLSCGANGSCFKNGIAGRLWVESTGNTAGLSPIDFLEGCSPIDFLEGGSGNAIDFREGLSPIDFLESGNIGAPDRALDGDFKP